MEGSSGFRHVLPDALLGVVAGILVHTAVVCLPDCAIGFSSPLLLLLAALVILLPAIFLRGRWPRRMAFLVSYATALLPGGLPGLFQPWIPA